MFKIIMCGWNTEKYIKRSIDSIINQTIKNWDLTIVIDPSEDKTYDIAKEYENDKIKVIYNEKRKLLMQNTVEGIKYSSPKSEDIIILVDLDDYLITNEALKIVNETYNSTRCILTYGSLVTESTKKRLVTYASYTNDEIIRKSLWRASHLKTFKYKLWNKIPENYLKDDEGNWFSTTSDMAMMFSMIELAGVDRCQYINDIIYCYNDYNIFNVMKSMREVQIKNEECIRNKQPLKLDICC